MSCKLNYQLRSRSKLQGILGAVNNPWFWRKLWNRFMQYLYPDDFQVVESKKPALDATLVSLDGDTHYSLLKDFVEDSPNIPLILNIGSFN